MKFFKTIADSIYSPAFYGSVVKGEYKSSFAYFFLFIIICAVLKTAFIAPQIVAFQDVVSTMGVQTIDKFPADLKVVIKNGKVSTNVKEPYLIPLPDLKSPDAAILIVIDTKTPYSAEQLKKYKTIAWLTGDTLFYARRASSGEIKVIPLTDVKDFTLDKDFVDSTFKTLSPLLKLIGPLLVILAVFGIYAGYIFELVYFFLLALLVWLVATVMKVNMDYWKAYRVSIHALTAPLLVGLVFALIQNWVPLHPFVFMYTFIALVVAGVNLYQYKKASGV